MPFCAECGSQVGGKFCGNCGAKIEAPSSQPVQHQEHTETSEVNSVRSTITLLQTILLVK
jgi:uncharacterized membrane protein YvbJ